MITSTGYKPVEISGVNVGNQHRISDVTVGNDTRVKWASTPSGWKGEKTIDDKQLIKLLTDAMSEPTSSTTSPSNQANALRVLVEFLDAKTMQKSGRSAEDIAKSKASLEDTFKQTFSNPANTISTDVSIALTLERARDNGIISASEASSLGGRAGEIMGDVARTNQRGSSGHLEPHHTPGKPVHQATAAPMPAPTPAPEPKPAAAPKKTLEGYLAERNEAIAQVAPLVNRLTAPQSNGTVTQADMKRLTELLSKAEPPSIVTGGSYTFHMLRNDAIKNAVNAFGSGNTKEAEKHISTLNNVIDRAVAQKLFSADQGDALKKAISKGFDTAGATPASAPKPEPKPHAVIMHSPEFWSLMQHREPMMQPKPEPEHHAHNGEHRVTNATPGAPASASGSELTKGFSAAATLALSDGKLDDNELRLLEQWMALIKNDQASGANSTQMAAK